MQTKNCYQCGKDKPLYCFSRAAYAKTNPDGLAKRCKACINFNLRIRYRDKKAGRVPVRSFRVDNPV